MKITAKKAKYVWKITRLLFVAVPLGQTITSVVDHDWFDAVPWFVMTIFTYMMIMMERNAFHHGFHFGQIMIMWCMSHDITPEEFAEMPEPEPWDLPWQEKKAHEDEQESS